MKKTVVITGGTRGIGKEWLRNSCLGDIMLS